MKTSNMGYEKKYKEAIELMKDCIPDADGLVHVRPQDIFPELKESEDERIREAMIDFFKHEREEGIVVLHYGVNIESMIAWLEKQGEKKAAWTPMDEQRVENLLAIIEGHGYPGEVTWLKSIKERVQPQPKQEWSEEDEQLYNDLSDTYFYNDEDYPEETYKRMLKRVLDWMNKRAKFLRPQSSDEQIKVCKEVYADILSAKGFDLGTVNSELNRLEEELKKIREE